MWGQPRSSLLCLFLLGDPHPFSYQVTQVRSSRHQGDCDGIVGGMFIRYLAGHQPSPHCTKRGIETSKSKSVVRPGLGLVLLSHLPWTVSAVLRHVLWTSLALFPGQCLPFQDNNPALHLGSLGRVIRWDHWAQEPWCLFMTICLPCSGVWTPHQVGAPPDCPSLHLASPGVCSRCELWLKLLRGPPAHSSPLPGPTAREALKEGCSLRLALWVSLGLGSETPQGSSGGGRASGLGHSEGQTGSIPEAPRLPHS